ncbi:MAG: alpha/beta hydrolase [Rhizomicrobium sp.]
MRRTRAFLAGLGCALILAVGGAGCSASEGSNAVTVDSVKSDSAAPQEFAIWPGTAPGSEKWTQQPNDFSLFGAHAVYNLVRPTLTAYFPDPGKATGIAVIVAPGGGFRFLNIDVEGTNIARWLAAHGIATFVLKYRTAQMPDSTPGFLIALTQYLGRLKDASERAAKGEISLAGGPDKSGSDTPPNMFDWPAYAVADGVRAMKLVRGHAAAWGIAPDKIGFMGFSAGSMVTYGVLTSAPPEDMPSFAAPLYYSLSPAVPLPAKAPPLFLAAASDDPISWGMPQTYARWIAAGHAAEIHMWAKGGHGLGMTQDSLGASNWIGLFDAWLGTEGFRDPKTH